MAYSKDRWFVSVNILSCTFGYHFGGRVRIAEEMHPMLADCREGRKTQSVQVWNFVDDISKPAHLPGSE
jgi:hypothetical protein